MKPSNILKSFLVTILLASTLPGILPAAAQDSASDNAAGVPKKPERKWMAELAGNASDDPLGFTEASMKKNKRKPVRRLIKGVGQELSKSAEYMGKDLFMFLSVQDIDPYAKDHPDFSKPCDVLTYRLVDGSSATLRRFPDRSFRVYGSLFDGTVLIPSQSNDFIIKYPNGTRGRVVGAGTGTVKIYRPDQTVTTMEKTMSGRYTMTNSKLGYMGTATPDRSGISYEM